MAQTFDDSDMKIVGAPAPAAARASSGETAAFLAELGRQHFNGNYAKAKELGSNIVSVFSYRSPPEELVETIRSFGVPVDEAVLEQAKILAVFSAEDCLNRYLPSSQLSGVALGEMYEVLQRILPAFYETLSHSTAFSFYYLAIKTPGDVPAAIGRQFAALCKQGDDERYARLGEALHSSNKAVYKRAISGFAFV